MPPKPSGDLAKIVLDNETRIADAEQKISVHHERIGILEKTTANMSVLPSTVASLGQKVESFGQQMVREVDGLREQHKAHQAQTEEKMEKGFKSIGEKVEAMGGAVSGLVIHDAKQNAMQRGWWQVLQVIGSILVGIALILEACKSLNH